MPRVRLAVALLVPPPAAEEIDGLRRACGDPALGRVAPHLTIVPPVNVRTELLPDALRVARAAAGEVRPLSLVLGPPRSFEPVNPTLYLAVEDDPDRPGGVDGVGTLHRRALAGPLARRLDHPHVAHVTLSQHSEPARIAAALEALGDYRAVVSIDRLHVMAEDRDLDGVRRWVPVADVPFGPVRVVGRGGLALELTATELVDPEATAVVRSSSEDRTGVGVPEGAVPLVVTARHDGRAIGVLTGWTRDGAAEETAVVGLGDDGWTRGDVASHLRAAFDSAAAERGCTSV